MALQVYSFLQLVFFICSLNDAAGKVYNIITISNPADLCSATPCLTLSTLATRWNYYVLDYSNTTLVFLPGTHYLTVNVSVSNVNNFSMISESTTAKIMCGDNSHIHFNYSKYIGISNLEFIGCGGNQVKQVKEFVVQDAVFKGQNTSSRTLEIIETTAQIVDGTFTFNTGSAIIAKASETNISRCKFENNAALHGGAIYAKYSIINMSDTIFTNNFAVIMGGVIFSLGSIVTIKECKFENNTVNSGEDTTILWACPGGGVLHSTESNITIVASIFNGNTANSAAIRSGGGVLYSIACNITIETSIFDKNTATTNCSYICGGGVLNSYRDNVSINASKFSQNSAITRGDESGGGVLHFEACTVTIKGSAFNNSTAITNCSRCGGGVLKSYGDSNITVNASKFNGNRAITWGYGSGGGVLHSALGTVTIEMSTFESNTATTNGRRVGGGVVHSLIDIITIKASQFNGNIATRGAVIFCYSCTITIGECKGNTTFENNMATFAVIYLIRDSVLSVRNSEHSLMMSKNIGSLAAFKSKIILKGFVQFTSNHPQTKSKSASPTATFQEGGAITLFHSNAHFHGNCTIQRNHGENGGALLSIMSKIYVYGDLNIAHNRADRNGGGVYLSKSELNCQHKSTLLLSNNYAGHRGGGLHAISSSIEVTSAYSTCSCYTGARLHFNENSAEMGGGLALEANAELIILRYQYNTVNMVNEIVTFTANSAHSYGGAVYVDDDTNSGSMCTSDSKTECFFQVLALHSLNHIDVRTQNILFSQNQANISGSTLYGGLLDRCTVSQFAEVYSKDARNGVAYLRGISLPPDDDRETIDLFATNNVSISSRPVKVCFCIENEYNCFHQLQAHIEVKKGAAFNVSLVAVNQLEQPVEATIRASLEFTESDLFEGQLTAEIGGECINLTFNIVSLHEYEELTLYAIDGPCKDADLSRRVIRVHFLPCSCPIGFQISGNTEINCTCDCHSNIIQYTEHCDILTESIIKKSQSRAWISYINNTNLTGYLVYENCPFDYCNPHSPPIILSQPNGADEQCAFNRSSLLCGSCRPGLGLSLGSSHCLQCPRYWPALLIAITLAATVAGIALVVLLLVLNMTVAVGTLNGLIFYVNVIHANRSTLLPFQEINALSIFVSWLNLGPGINVCYFPGMDANVKMWLQLAFPAYVIFLVFSIIKISSRSIKFSSLISKKDPVATLATLILFSYAKILEICFESLSVGTLSYPDGTRVPLWLPDATVKYLYGEHIPLFIVAVLILTIGLIYTAVLFSWQWLLYLPDWRVFKWTRNQRLQTFIETHHAPFTPKHRYWAGLLLIARIILYVIATANVSNDPHLALYVIIFTVSCILLLRAFIQASVYRKSLVNLFETFFFLNILFFSMFTEYSLSNPSISQETVANISVSAAFLVMLLIIFYHMYAYTTIFSIFKKTLITSFGVVRSLFTTNDQDAQRERRLSLPHDDDIPRFSELLSINDCSVNTNDYSVPLLTDKPMESCTLHLTEVEVHQPYIPPPQSEKSKT